MRKMAFMAAGFLCALVLCSCSTPTATQGQTESMPSLAADTSSAYGSASATSVIPSDVASTEATGSTQRQESTAAIRPENSVIRPEQTAPPTQDTTESRKPPAASTESNRSTSSTHSETASTTAGAANTTTALSASPTTEKSPWVYPYDVAVITQECKEEIARVGLVWDEGLSIDNSSWNHPYNTGVFTEYPDEYSLRSYIFDEMIPFYVKNQERYSLKRCKIWLESDTEYPGDYNIYLLYSTY